MTTRIQELEIQVAQYRVEAQVWKEAYKMMVYHGVPVNDEVLKKVRSKKTTAENFEEGEKHAELFLKTNNVEDMEKQLAGVEDGSVVGVKNIFLAGVASWLREKAIEVIVGFLTKLLRENAVKVVDWLLSQTEDKVIDGYIRLSDEDKFLFKNELKQYPRFNELLNKIEEKEK